MQKNGQAKKWDKVGFMRWEIWINIITEVAEADSFGIRFCLVTTFSF